MGEAQRERDWETVSALMALIANVNSSKRGKTYKADDFNPTVSRQQAASRRKILPYSRDNLNLLKSVFERKKSK